jgi:hypothetical protein
MRREPRGETERVMRRKERARKGGGGPQVEMRKYANGKYANTVQQHEKTKLR